MRIKKIIDSYVKSHFDLSIGTGAAIAALVQSENAIYVDAKGVALEVIKYNENIDTIIINVETIARNIINSIDTTIRDKAINSYQEYIHTLVKKEILYIDNILEGRVRKDVYFFFPNYKKVYDIYYTQKRKTAPTKRELAKIAIENISYSLSRKADKLDINYIVDEYKLDIRGDVLLLTHYGHDLLNYKRNKRLKLLESHTGNVIDYTKFNKKYRNSTGKDTSRLPWNEILVMCIGTETITSPLRGSLGMILDLAEDKKWTPNTSIDKVISDLRRIDKLKDFTKFKGIY